MICHGMHQSKTNVDWLYIARSKIMQLDLKYLDRILEWMV